MKRLTIALGLCLAIAPAAFGQTPKYGVTVTPEKNVNYAAFKTYSWTDGQPSQDKTVNAAIIAAVDRELAALGMTKAASGPGDVLVAYYGLTRTDVNLKGKADASGMRPQYTVGSLMVALLEPASRKRVLRLRIDKPIEMDREKPQPIVDAAVKELFEKYPTRRK